MAIGEPSEASRAVATACLVAVSVRAVGVGNTVDPLHPNVLEVEDCFGDEHRGRL